MNTPFQPADGETARWRYCYQLVDEAQPGDEITYRQVQELLDCTRQQALAAMREAKHHLEQNKRHTVRTVTKFGWIVLDASGNLREADDRIKRARRGVDRSIRVMTATNREELSQIERARLDFQMQQAHSARGLYQRKTRTLAELEKESKQREQSSTLPFTNRKDTG